VASGGSTVQRRDIKAVGALAGDASAVVTTLVRDMHAGIASRVFAAVGPPSRPTQIVHGGIARAVYAAVDHGLGAAAGVGGAVAGELWGREGDQSLESGGRAAATIAAVNGIYGDQMASHSDGLAPARAAECSKRILDQRL
jgi:hypothetical protein